MPICTPSTVIGRLAIADPSILSRSPLTSARETVTAACAVSARPTNIIAARDTNANIVDWLNQQVGLAVPEYQWHAGATPYARVNYLMVLVEEVFQTLPVSWDEAVGQSEDGETVRDALKCIAQAVRSAKLEPQVVLGT